VSTAIKAQATLTAILWGVLRMGAFVMAFSKWCRRPGATCPKF